MTTGKPTIERIELSMKEVERILERARTGPLDDKDREMLRNTLLSYLQMTELLENERTTIRQLRKLLFGSSSEKTGKLFPQDKGAQAESDASDDDASESESEEDSDEGDDAAGEIWSKVVFLDPEKKAAYPVG